METGAEAKKYGRDVAERLRKAAARGGANLFLRTSIVRTVYWPALPT
jgi:hypothetical protein